MAQSKSDFYELLFLWAIAAAQAAENHKDKYSLSWYLWGLNISTPNWIHLQNSVATAGKTQFERYSWNHVNTTKRLWNDFKLALEYSNKYCVVQRSIPICVWGKPMETETATWSAFINGKDTVD